MLTPRKIKLHNTLIIYGYILILFELNAGLKFISQQMQRISWKMN